MIVSGKYLIFYNTCGTLLFKERSKSVTIYSMIERAKNELHKYLAHSARESFSVCHRRRKELALLQLWLLLVDVVLKPLHERAIFEDIKTNHAEDLTQSKNSRTLLSPIQLVQLSTMVLS